MGMMSLIGNGFLETLFMTLVSTILAYLLGLPLGVILVISEKQGILTAAPRKAGFIRIVNNFNRVLNIIVNMLRSVPFLILLFAVSPLTKAIMGTTVGSKAAIVSLTIAAFPFIARLVESSLKEVDKGVIEAAQSMGARTWQIVYKVLLHEAKPSILVGAAIATTTILGYSAMAGIVGGGGLGAIAINYGYYRSETSVMWVMIVVLVAIVQVFQGIGMRLANWSNKRI